jgi:hypothetical protein
VGLCRTWLGIFAVFSLCRGEKETTKIAHPTATLPQATLFVSAFSSILLCREARVAEKSDEEAYGNFD